jgi:hypothetical protein
MSNMHGFTDHTVAVYATHDNAEAAIKHLSSAGFDLQCLSIVGQNYSTQEQPVGFINTGNRMLSWGKFGAFWGSIWGLFFGSAMMFIPGIGTLMFAGWLVGMLEGAVIGGGLAALGAAFAGIGIPKDSIVEYERELKAGSFLVMAHGNEADTARAKAILSETSPTRIESYASGQLVGVGR